MGLGTIDTSRKSAWCHLRPVIGWFRLRPRLPTTVPVGNIDPPGPPRAPGNETNETLLAQGRLTVRSLPRASSPMRLPSPMDRVEVMALPPRCLAPPHPPSSCWARPNSAFPTFWSPVFLTEAWTWSALHLTSDKRHWLAWQIEFPPSLPIRQLWLVQLRGPTQRKVADRSLPPCRA